MDLNDQENEFLNTAIDQIMGTVTSMIEEISPSSNQEVVDRIYDLPENQVLDALIDALQEGAALKSSMEYTEEVFKNFEKVNDDPDKDFTPVFMKTLQGFAARSTRASIPIGVCARRLMGVPREKCLGSPEDKIKARTKGHQSLTELGLTADQAEDFLDAADAQDHDKIRTILRGLLVNSMGVRA